MSRKDLILVANKFSEFAIRSGALTSDQLHALLKLPASMLPDRLVLHRGQGVSDEDVQTIIAAVAEVDPTGARWDMSRITDAVKRADGEHSHKRKRCNTLVADPVRIVEDLYRMDLLVDQDCELMGDHQTGQHIQGMVLIEAARQAFLVVTERFFLADRKQKSYFVINSVGSEFQSFVFPVHAHLDYRVIDKDITDRRQKFEVEIDVVQCGKTCMTSRFSFTVYPASLIAEKERALAEIAVAAMLGAQGQMLMAGTAA